MAILDEISGTNCVSQLTVQSGVGRVHTLVFAGVIVPVFVGVGVSLP
jgi:hypothetical protein